LASIKEVEDWISSRTYPHVARTSDPLIVRVSRFSLLVNDTNFYAKIKNGLGYKGYLIYSSGLGTPILEESATNETEFFSNDAFKKAISDNGTNTKDKFYESTERVQTVLQDAAQSWLDTLELEIAKQPNDNAIKKAIDRLCWQLHYDITESHTNFPEVFKDNDFGDVQIDWDKNDTWNGKTVNESVFDNYTAISTSVTDGSSIISGGSSLDGVRLSISTFRTDLNTTFSTFDDNLNGTLTSTANTIKTSVDKVGTNLKADSDEYTISKALRDSATSDKSVSNQVKLQCDEIKSGLGPNGSINKSLGIISDKVSIEGESGTVIGKLISLDNKLGQGPDGTSNNTVLYRLSELYTNTYNTKLNTDTVVDRIGSYGQDSIMHNLHDMNSTLTGLKADYSDGGKIIHTIRTWPVT
jgi:hypothetical protein